MTVLINATSAKMGGALTYIGNLARALDTLEIANMTFVILVSEAISLPPLRTVVVHIVSESICSSPIRLLIWQQTSLRSLIKKCGADLLFSSANFATFFCPIPQILLIRIPHYFSSEYRQYILPHKSFIEKIDFYARKLLICLSMAHASHIIFQTESSRSDVVKEFTKLRKEKTSVNWFGTTLSIQPSTYTQGEVVRLLSTSHYSDYKNYTTLLRALKKLTSDGFTQFIFTAPIDPSLPLFRSLFTTPNDLDLIHSPELDGRLNLLGPIPYRELVGLYTSADIFLWPSLAETFGQPLIEAMSAGLPIICSDIPINREICTEAALYVTPLDHVAWARTIRELALNQSLQKDLAERAQTRATLFTWENHFARLIDLFRTYSHEPRQHSHSDI